MGTYIYKPRAVQVASFGFALFGGCGGARSLYTGLQVLDASDFGVLFESMFGGAFCLMLIIGFAFIELKIHNARRFVTTIAGVAVALVFLGILVNLIVGSPGGLISIIGLLFYAHVLHRFRQDDVKDYFIRESGREDAPYSVILVAILSAFTAIMIIGVVGFVAYDPEYADIGWVALLIASPLIIGHSIVSLGVLTRWNWARVLAFLIVAVYGLAAMGFSGLMFMDEEGFLEAAMATGIVAGLYLSTAVFVVVSMHRGAAREYYRTNDTGLAAVPKNIDDVFR